MLDISGRVVCFFNIFSVFATRVCNVQRSSGGGRSFWKLVSNGGGATVVGCRWGSEPAVLLSHPPAHRRQSFHLYHPSVASVHPSVGPGSPPPPHRRSEPFRLSRAGGYERGSIQACERRREGTSAARYQSRAAILARLLERAAPPLAAGRDSSACAE